MADQSIVHIGENSPQQVAYRLMHDIAHVEKVVLLPHMAKDGAKLADRDWILSTYVECVLATTRAAYSKP